MHKNQIIFLFFIRFFPSLAFHFSYFISLTIFIIFFFFIYKYTLCAVFEGGQRVEGAFEMLKVISSTIVDSPAAPASVSVQFLFLFLLFVRQEQQP